MKCLFASAGRTCQLDEDHIGEHDYKPFPSFLDAVHERIGLVNVNVAAVDARVAVAESRIVELEARLAGLSAEVAAKDFDFPPRTEMGAMARRIGAVEGRLGHVEDRVTDLTVPRIELPADAMTPGVRDDCRICGAVDGDVFYRATDGTCFCATCVADARANR